MGDPRKIRSKFKGPRHPWQKQRIEDEKKFMKEFGLVNKTEIYRANSKLSNYSDSAKRLIAATGAQADKERQQLLDRLNRLGLLPQGAQLDQVLTLTVKDFLERRLQTLVFRKSLARSVKQARQFITHEHFTIKGTVVTSPGYIVLTEEQDSINFKDASALSGDSHPERVIIKKTGEVKA